MRYILVQPDKTLQKAAIEKYLDGGFNLTAIVNQVLSLVTRSR